MRPGKPLPSSASPHCNDCRRLVASASPATAGAGCTCAATAFSCEQLTRACRFASVVAACSDRQLISCWSLGLQAIEWSCASKSETGRVVCMLTCVGGVAWGADTASPSANMWSVATGRCSRGASAAAAGRAPSGSAAAVPSLPFAATPPSSYTAMLAATRHVCLAADPSGQRVAK